jgi:hypothetical protein
VTGGRNNEPQQNQQQQNAEEVEEEEKVKVEEVVESIKTEAEEDPPNNAANEVEEEDEGAAPVFPVSASLLSSRASTPFSQISSKTSADDTSQPSTAMLPPPLSSLMPFSLGMGICGGPRAIRLTSDGILIFWKLFLFLLVRFRPCNKHTINYWLSNTPFPGNHFRRDELLIISISQKCVVDIFFNNNDGPIATTTRNRLFHSNHLPGSHGTAF